MFKLFKKDSRTVWTVVFKTHKGNMKSSKIMADGRSDVLYQMKRIFKSVEVIEMAELKA